MIWSTKLISEHGRLSAIWRRSFGFQKLMTWRHIVYVQASKIFLNGLNIPQADLHIAIGNFLDSFAEIDPTKMVVKVKTHLLTHAPADVRLFGPLLGAITEAFESFNAAFRGASILSNHRAPSRDIAIRLSALEGVKHRAAGGTWPIKEINNETVWTRCGPSARQLLQDHPILQRLLVCFAEWPSQI
jgi:hypothetical protein